MRKDAQRTILVTGASAGIGAGIAREAAGLGWKVAIGARRMDRLETVAGELRELGAEVFAGTLDVSDEGSVERFFEGSEAAIGTADVVVNNAGHSKPCLLHEYPAGQLRSEIETNLLGTMLVTGRAVRRLRAEGRRGDLVFISSDSVRNPRPGQLAYGATKAAVENMADGLAKELEGTGIRVLKLRLGPTASEFGFGWTQEQHESAAALWQKFALRDSRLGGSFLTEAQVGRAIVHAVTQPPGVLIDTLELQPEIPSEEAPS